jgi:hypothetical protein
MSLHYAGTVLQGGPRRKDEDWVVRGTGGAARYCDDAQCCADASVVDAAEMCCNTTGIDGS